MKGSGMKHTLLRCLVACIPLLASLYSYAQAVPVPRPAPGQTVSPTDLQYFDISHLKDRPYTFDLPKPQFPSSDRVQREFVVEYIYEYALSNYTPVVTLPTIPAMQAKRDTPENALIAMFSAMRTGDYDAWLNCWDATTRDKLIQDAKAGPRDAAFWKKLWRDVLTGAKQTTLVDRVETVDYIILDAQLSGTNPMRVPTVFKYVEGKWLATNDLTTNPILYSFNPNLAGNYSDIDLIPVARLDKDNTQQTQAQQKFLDQRALRDKVIEVGK